MLNSKIKRQHVHKSLCYYISPPMHAIFNEQYCKLLIKFVCSNLRGQVSFRVIHIK